MSRAENTPATRIEIDRSVRTGRYDVLSDAPCKAALRCIRRAEGPVGLADLAESLYAGSLDRPLDPASDVEQRSVELRLHERDLPRLERYGAVDYDRERGIIRARPVNDVRPNAARTDGPSLSP